MNEAFMHRPCNSPMVPRGTARLRTILSADHTKEDLDKVVDALEECAKALDLIR